MKPPRFKYHDPATLAEALGLLAQYGDDAKILAGGQSLMPVLNFRLARPANLIDVNRIPDLEAVEVAGDGIGLGALVRQRALERSELVRQRCPLISQALPYVGHPQIRNRGTIGGSLAHADPAAELPAVMVAADAHFTLHKSTGTRVVAAEDFFVGQLTTLLEPDEMLVRIDIPASPEQTGSSLQEVAMRLGDFALGGVATTLTLGRDGHVSRARIVCFGVGERPLRQTEAEQSLEGAVAGHEAFAEAGRIVSTRVTPTDDIHASASYRKRLAGILTRRALTAAHSAIREVVTA
jgi:aerobic carbon-monoxide dehydrogenase medium subunit